MGIGILEKLAVFSKTRTGILTGVVILAVLFYAIFYKINSHVGEKQNELIDIEYSEVPTDSDFDTLCSMPDKNESCPELGESKVRGSRNSDRINR